MRNIDADKFKNQYRIKSARHPAWNYAANGFYYVTICTYQKECFFGDVINAEMRLSAAGEIADRLWRAIPDHFPFVILDEHRVMPNHVHGIIGIERPDNMPPNLKTQINELHQVNGLLPVVETRLIASLPDGHKISRSGGITGKHNPMGKHSLGEIIRWYKGRVKHEIKRIKPDFAWQTRFYDRIIRDDDELNRIRQYIMDNSFKWELDRNNPENLWM